MMKQVKCPKCNKTLFRVYDNDPYKIEVKCPRCKAIIVATEEYQKESTDERVSEKTI